MKADPCQKKNLAGERPQVVRELAARYEAWFADVTKDGFERIAVGVGYRQRPLVELPGHEAYLESVGGGGISYNDRFGWANDWITSWMSEKAYAWWDIEVVREGRYEVTLLYTCPKENLGSRMRVEVGEKVVEGLVGKTHNPEPIHSPDRVERKEVYEKVWARLKLGTIRLAKGRSKLILRCVKMPGGRGPDIKAVRVRKSRDRYFDQTRMRIIKKGLL